MDIIAQLFSSALFGFAAIFNFEDPYSKKIGKILRRSDRQNMRHDLRKLEQDYCQAFKKFSAANPEVLELMNHSYKISFECRKNENQLTYAENKAKLVSSTRQHRLKTR